MKPNRISRLALTLCLLVLAGMSLLAASPASPAAHVPEPAQVPTVTQSAPGLVRAIAAGGAHACALTNAGGVKCWGSNQAGQVGDGTTTLRGTPVDVSGLTSGVIAITAGDQHTCALTGGGVKCWGSNFNGQLGDGTKTDRWTPVDVSAVGSAVVALAAGSFHTCALTASGAVKCWGVNFNGALGDGTVVDRQTPVDVGGLSGPVVGISAGGETTCALMKSGGVECWGANFDGQLLDGTTNNQTQAVKLNSLGSDVARIAVSRDDACVLTKAGAVKCWGGNQHGQLGNGTVKPGFGSGTLTPVEPAGLTSGVIGLSVGQTNACARLGAGAVQCWGQNDQGQLGDGTTADRSTPAAVAGPTNGVADISTDGNFTCALLSSGAVKCWGRNAEGQLGNGTFRNASVPVDVVGFGPAVVASPTPAAIPTPVGAFRPAGPLVPDLTTFIPTPLDISTDPAVITTNLLLAGLATLVFTIFSEILNNTLAENEERLQRRLGLARRVGQGLSRVGRALSAHLGRPGLLDFVKTLAIMLFYGLVFSLLDRSWYPLSLKGVTLFVTMVIAFGLVSLADDLVRFWAARRWGIPASLDLRPANLLLAMGSTAISRLLGINPGIMFGTPEAYNIDESRADDRLRARLLLAGAGTILLIGLSGWLVTSLTARVLKLNILPDAIAIFVAGFQGFLLVIFAVSLQNAFLQMVAMPGSYGRALLKWNRWVWAGGFFAVTFLLYDTIINTDGALAQAANNKAVLLFLLSITAFSVVAVAVWLYFHWLRPVQRTQRH